MINLAIGKMHKPSGRGHRFMAALDQGAHVLEQGVKWAGIAKSIYDAGQYVAPLLAAL